MKTRPSAPGKINAPSRLTSRNISPAPFRLFLCGANLSRGLIGKSGGMSSCIIFGSDLAAELEFSYGAGQTVNLLALRLQWFESTPTQASSCIEPGVDSGW